MYLHNSLFNVLLQKAKIVFDPSDVHIPKKRKKKSEKFASVNTLRKPMLSKKNIMDVNIKPTNTTANELVDYSLNETTFVSSSSEHSLSDSPVRYATPEIFQEELTICCMCTEDTSNKDRESISCPICMIKGTYIFFE